MTPTGNTPNDDTEKLSRADLLNPRKFTLRDVEQAIRSAALEHGVDEVELALDLAIPLDQRDAIVNQVKEILDLPSPITQRTEMHNFGDLYAFVRGYLGLVDPSLGESSRSAVTSSPEVPPLTDQSETPGGGSSGTGTGKPPISNASTSGSAPIAPTSPGDHLRAVHGEQGHRLSSPPSAPAGTTSGDATPNTPADPLPPQTPAGDDTTPQ